MILRKKKHKKTEFLNLNKSKSLSPISTTGAVALALMLLLAAGTAALVFPITASGQSEPIKVQIKSSLLLNRNSHQVLNITKEKADIVPGESNIQREAREKAEAEAKVKLASLKSKRDTISRERRVYNDPADFTLIYKAAEARYGVDWRLLKAIHYVETGCSGSTTKANPSGAAGPMQFIASTFARHAQDGNGDGVLDRYNVEDAMLTAAAYLKACGYPDAKRALWGYNPSRSYYFKVMEVAQSLGYNS